MQTYKNWVYQCYILYCFKICLWYNDLNSTDLKYFYITYFSLYEGKEYIHNWNTFQDRAIWHKMKNVLMQPKHIKFAFWDRLNVKVMCSIFL